MRIREGTHLSNIEAVAIREAVQSTHLLGSE